MKLFLYLILFTVVVAFALTFSLKNPQVVTLYYYPDLSVTAPLVIVLLVTLLLGAVIGLLVSWGRLLKKQRELGRARREVKKLDQEVQNLRSLPLKEPAQGA
jgi:uncharacterized integral membrane protein